MRTSSTGRGATTGRSRSATWFACHSASGLPRVPSRSGEFMTGRVRRSSLQPVAQPGDGLGARHACRFRGAASRPGRSRRVRGRTTPGGGGPGRRRTAGTGASAGAAPGCRAARSSACAGGSTPRSPPRAVAISSRNAARFGPSWLSSVAWSRDDEDAVPGVELPRPEHRDGVRELPHDVAGRPARPGRRASGRTGSSGRGSCGYGKTRMRKEESPGRSSGAFGLSRVRRSEVAAAAEVTTAATEVAAPAVSRHRRRRSRRHRRHRRRSRRRRPPVPPP